MIAASSQPLWPGELTAWGTLAVAIVAVAVALFAEWRAGIRVTSERTHAAKVLAAERLAADERLTRQLEHSDRQLLEERIAAHERLTRQLEHSDKQLQEERATARDQEQEASARAIEVTLTWFNDPGTAGQTARIPGGKLLQATVTNHSSYTITQLAARLSPDGSNLLEPSRTERPGILGIPGLSVGHPGVLTPGQAMTFGSDSIDAQFVTTPDASVRWTDRLGQAWQYRKGDVRKINQDDSWIP